MVNKEDAYSIAFRNFLKSSEVNFSYKDITKDSEAKEHTKELYGGIIKAPTLFVDGEIFKTPTSEDFNKIMKNLNLRA